MAAKDDELTRRVERLAGVGFCSTPSFSPDGSRIAFISDLSGTPQVWTVATGGGWPQRVTAFPDQVTNARWSPGGELIAVEVAPGGGLNQQVYVLGPDGSALKLLTPGGDENNRLSRWSRDARTLFVASIRDDRAAFDTFAVDVAAGSWKKITKTRGITTISDTSVDGTRALITRSVARGNNDAYLIDLATGDETLLTQHEGQSSFFGPRFGADGAIWLDTDDGREHSGLARIELAGGRPRPLEYAAAREDAELEGAVMDDAGSRALLVWNHAGRSELEWFDVKTRARSAAASAPAEIVAGVAWSPRGDRFALACTGSAAPVDIWTLSPDSPVATPLTASAHPGVDLSALIRPTLETFTAHDGLALSGWLYVPRDFKRPGPLVLSFHGGPEGQERPIFNRTYQALLASGIAVFAPHVRGSSGFGKTFVHLDDREKRFDGVRDIQACADHVVKIGVADRKRLGITGGSYGGYMSMAGITQVPDLFAGAAGGCGGVN